MTITEHKATVDQTQVHYLTSGAGEPVLLLHGWPQTSNCWRSVIPLLADSHFIVAPDLRGLGQTSDPGKGFAKSSIAAELARLMTEELGFSRFHVVGHDWGGVVAFSLAAHHPELVTSLAVVDVAIPSSFTPLMSQSGKRWHHAFHQTPGLPEALVEGREELYLNWFYDNYGASPDAVGPGDRAEYIGWYSKPEVLRAGFEYYRAIEIDRAECSAVPRLAMPVLAVGGGTSWGRGNEVKKSLEPLVEGPVDELIIPTAGHWVPEEEPAVLATAILQHVYRHGEKTATHERAGGDFRK